MRIKIKNIFLLVSFLIISTIVYIYLTKKKSYDNRSLETNQKISSFKHAKKLASKFYNHQNFKTFYCGCSFKNKFVNLKSCLYKPISPKSKRAHRIEWEHVVPASIFGKNLPAWKKGHIKCKTRTGQPFKGRKCARHISNAFRYMEADLYNLVPSIGEVNALRSNYPIGFIDSKFNDLGPCSTKINNKKILPRKEVRGFVSRIYRYMDKAYPGHNIINHNNKNLILSWSKKYLPSKHEITRNRYIKKVQGNDINTILELDM